MYPDCSTVHKSPGVFLRGFPQASYRIFTVVRSDCELIHHITERNESQGGDCIPLDSMKQFRHPLQLSVPSELLRYDENYT